MRTRRIAFIVLMLLTIVIAGYFFDLRKQASDEIVLGDNPSLPTLTFYTTPGATAPQLPFWAAYHSGELGKLFNVKVVAWKNTEQLKSFMLAGVGDLWLGHVEGFALAKKRGAPVQLLAISGWKKFYFVSRNPAIKSLDELKGLKVGVTPPGSPAVAIVKAVMGENFSTVTFVPQEPEVLFNSLKMNTVDGGLIPEPLLSILQAKLPEFASTISLEEAFGKKFNMSPRLPLAGFAINTNFAKQYPDQVSALIKLLEKGAGDAANVEDAFALFPQKFPFSFPQKILEKSLKNEIILVKPAREVKDEIAQYLKLVEPELLGGSEQFNIDDSFFY